MNTTDVMVPLWDDTTVPRWVTEPPSKVVLTVPCLLRRDPVLQISYSPTPGNLVHINHTNAFAMRPMVTINERCNVHMVTMRISEHSDDFTRMVEQFNNWQREVYNYRIALENYRQANNVEIDILWESGSN